MPIKSCSCESMEMRQLAWLLMEGLSLVRRSTEGAEVGGGETVLLQCMDAHGME